MTALTDVDELLRAHALVTGGTRGAPRIQNGARVGSSLLRASTTLISAALQAEIEDTFKAALPLTFDHFNQDELERYWSDCKGWGNPNPHNVRRLFFRLGFADALDGLSWKKCSNATVITKLDTINQVRNRIAHGQPLTVNNQEFRLTSPVVHSWRAFAGQFVSRFRPLILDQYED
ncbi:HEPN domain-containing protein [Brevundimonas sp. CEF1]|uniref:HEPN domain-containing protein n=1 Tax=Brevundimonas sp. CEF1 TaxID=3442642 RepID=UPI003F516EA0